MGKLVTAFFLSAAFIPSIYYLLAIYSSRNFFAARRLPVGTVDFTPPLSNLKPVKGVDPGAYENFASLCRQDYPHFELLFCVDADNTAILEVLEKLKGDFPERSIRVLIGSGRIAPNDKVAKLVRLVEEAKYEVLVINDSDVRARPDYLRTVVRPLADPQVGAVTLPYVSLGEHTFADQLQSVGMYSDFYPGVFVARQLDGIKFALGPTIATTRSQLQRFGGYASIENAPGDDLLVGRLIAGQGSRVELLQYAVETVADFSSFRELFQKRLRWIVVMRYMRRWGHLGLGLTQALPWTIVAICLAPSATLRLTYLALYFLLRAVLTWLIAGYGFKRTSIWRKLLLIPVWDVLAFFIWCTSFARRSVHWRGEDYYIRRGRLVPVLPGGQK